MIRLSKVTRQLRDEVVAELRALGVTGPIETKMGGSHPYVEFSYQGKTRRHYFPRVFGSYRTIDNIHRDVRNQLTRPNPWEKK